MKNIFSVKNKIVVITGASGDIGFNLSQKFTEAGANVYGIDMPSANELIAHGRELDDICQLIGADKLIYQTLEDLVSAVSSANPDISNFETSVFNGQYVTQDIDQAYLEKLDALRNNETKETSDKNADSIIDMHNEGAE